MFCKDVTVYFLENGTTNCSKPAWGKDDYAITIAMMQIRRYLYGQLNDYLLARYISGQIKYLRVDG
jgi:hypothetical protein